MLGGILLKRDPTAFLREEFQALVEKDLDWRPPILQGPSDVWVRIDGKRMLMLCSNNYLGLANHPVLREAALKAIETHGAGSGSVRPIAGNMDVHVELEERIARFKRCPAALVYQSGFATNEGLIPQLAGEGDVILTDELNHGSIIDGVRLTKAERLIYKHSDAASLESGLKEAEAKGARRILVISDGVFSMDGDVAPVDQIVKAAEPHGAMVYIDDAHGEGVLGEGGRGVASHFGVEGRVQVEMGTFSKAFGVVGGYVAGSKDLRNFALNKSRSWLLSGSHPPAVAAACLASVDYVEKHPELVHKLWDNTNYFKKELRSMGFDIGRSVTPITPVMVGDSPKAKELSAQLMQQKVFALPIVFPMVARDAARIRTIMNAALTRDDLDFALQAFEKAGKTLNLV